MIHVADNYQTLLDSTVGLWIELGLITENAYGIAYYELVDGVWLSDTFGVDTVGKKKRKHDKKWYIGNASGKGLICQEAGMDSLIACTLFPRLAAQLNGAFPYGGGVIGKLGDRIVAVSGGAEDEDIMLADWLLDVTEMRDAREARHVIDRTRSAGKAYKGTDRAKGANVRFVSA